MARSSLIAIFVAVVCMLGVHAHAPHSRLPLQKVYGDPMGYSTSTLGGGPAGGVYTVNITVGTPPQHLTMLLDTSSALIVAAQAQCNPASPPFNSVKSSTSKTLECTSDMCKKCNVDPTASTCLFGTPACGNDWHASCAFSTSYGGNNIVVAGPQTLDTVCVGGVCVDGAVVSLADEGYPYDGCLFSLIGVDGVFGLGPSYLACNPSCVPTFMDSAANTSNIANMFGLYLDPSGGGTLDLGGYDTSNVVNNSIQWAAIEVEHYYNLVVVDVVLGGDYYPDTRLFGLQSTNDNTGVFLDSGSSLIMLNPLMFASLQSIFETNFSSLPGISNGTFFSGGCLNQTLVDPTMFPSFMISVLGDDSTSNIELAINGSAYLIPTGNQYCFGFGQADGVGIVLGQPFMSQFYTVYDRTSATGPRVGFGQL